MTHVGLLLLCVVSIEMVASTEFVRQIVLAKKTTAKLLSLIPNRKVGDNWKEKLVPYYAFSILLNLTKVLMKLGLIFGLFLLLGFLLEEFFALIMSWKGLLEMAIFCLAYVTARRFTGA